MGQRRYDCGILIEEWDDDTCTYRRFEGGALVEERPYTADEAAAPEARASAMAAEDRRQELRSAARDALAGNRDFLALPSPTGAQTVGQVQDLTRQINALIRLEINDLSGTD